MVNPGTVKNLSVAVMVNKELDEDQTAVITQAVSTALGLDPLRQDKINVTGLLFDTSLSEEFQKSITPAPAPFNKVYIYAAAVAAAIILGTVLLLVFRRRKKVEPVEQPVRPTLLEPEEPSMSPEVLTKQRMRDSVEKLARANPESVATLVKTWLLEDER
jgi:flagellar M-ring protein FliF